MTARQPAYRITTGPRPPRASRERYGTLRGLAAVARLLLTAADALITALAGIPPLAWLWHQAADIIRATYREAAWPPPEMVAALVIPSAATERGNTDGSQRR
jgi:hypothetical protein